MQHLYELNFSIGLKQEQTKYKHANFKYNIQNVKRELFENEKNCGIFFKTWEKNNFLTFLV